ncbi:MAG: complex I subunit 1 family protein [Candidatus Bathyarchaeia archaeon]
MEFFLQVIIFIMEIFLAIFIGCLLYWLFRKLRARFQARKGPPWYQTFADLIKLFSKETLVPSVSGGFVFIIAPIFSVIGYLIALSLIPIMPLPPTAWFAGDLIVLLYCLALPSVAIILAGSSSSSPYGAIGASREASLMVAYEIPFMISTITVAIDANSLSLLEIMKLQLKQGAMALRYPFATLAFIICLLAKLSRKPFDIADADTEIVAGPFTEYSGFLLALFELSNALKWFILPAFGVNLFFIGVGAGGGLDFMNFLFLCLSLVVLASFLDAQNPRFRIEQAFRFYLTLAFALSVLDFIRALV